ncbi:hypothetical protein [Tannerella forsythia]|uniref:hypothetical protein n=1 Tax=Tannerella forsythia TaxID=28112 RepID=UPI0028DB5BCE|nr:hypothetical protein [Tannerella forsythia]
MAKGKRYEGEFISVAGVRYRVEIWQEGYSGNVGELSFPYDTPLTIEWSEVNKIEPVMSSAATLTVISDSDRRFVDLYTTVAGSIRLDVYRENKKYWSGTLDPEIYEEPFAQQDGYDVTLTFSDFAILDRIKFEKTTRRFWSLQALLDLCIQKSGVELDGVQEYISTTTGKGALLLANTCLIDENFFDEDNEPMTLREILDEMLRPFALRLQQKDGKAHIYDIHTLHSLQTKPVRWCLDDSTLGVDQTFNNCELTFSPYMKNKLIEAENDPAWIKDSECTSHRVNVDYSANDLPGFDMLLKAGTLSKSKFRIYDLFNLTKFFKIKPILSGDSEAGVAFVFHTRRGDQDYVPQCGHVQNVGEPSAVVEVKDRPFIFVDDDKRNNYLLNLKIEALVDVRYNPFEDAGDDNERGWWKEFNHQCNYSYIPFRLILRDENGQALFHYDNSEVLNTWINVNTYETGRQWFPGAGDWNSAHAAYYEKDVDGRKKKTGWGGWKTNQPIIGYYRWELPSIFDKMFEGEYIPMPPVSGWLEVQVGSVLKMKDYGFVQTFDHQKIHWFLLKNVTMNLVGAYGQELSEDDIVVRAWVDKAAKEGMEIDTVCGTMPDWSHPTARGQFFLSSRETISNFTRAGVTDKVERLLLGTVYSQYYGRKKKLSGTADIVSELSPMTDEHESGKFMIVSEIQDLIKDESNLAMVEIAQDNFTGIPYEED